VVDGRTPLGMSPIIWPQLIMRFVGLLMVNIKVEGFKDAILILRLSHRIEVTENGRK
jgi:hypothetical protein